MAVHPRTRRQQFVAEGGEAGFVVVDQRDEQLRWLESFGPTGNYVESATVSVGSFQRGIEPWSVILIRELSQ